jgi:hypothetical protein
LLTLSARNPRKRPSERNASRHLGEQIAALKITEKRLRAGRRIFDRPAELARRPQHQAELGKDPVAHPKIAADIVRQHPHLFGGDAENRGELGLLPDRPAAAGIERVPAACRVVMAECGARLDRHPGHPADM